ncbi:hypothetical protein GWK47_018959 [Chionoecetes opilio]|uniref:Uncharacterized protein n=1 Tax=Chionoecetes opilio TaxID=41210 RepID=A0A8J4XQT0_CHIOP|nr:hypothetical protein GWK47_018959 [Chionoecetes opilio]
MLEQKWQTIHELPYKLQTSPSLHSCEVQDFRVSDILNDSSVFGLVPIEQRSHLMACPGDRRVVLMSEMLCHRSERAPRSGNPLILKELWPSRGSLFENEFLTLGRYLLKQSQTTWREKNYLLLSSFCQLKDLVPFTIHASPRHDNFSEPLPHPLVATSGWSCSHLLNTPAIPQHSPVLIAIFCDTAEAPHTAPYRFYGGNSAEFSEMRWVAGVLFCLAAIVSAEATDALKKILYHKELSESKSGPAEENVTPGSIQVGSQRFLGVSSTTTHTSVVMVTSTVFFSCLSGTSATVCQGRRRRKSLPSVVQIDDEDSSSSNSKALDGSLVDPDATESYTSSSSSSSDPREADKDTKFQFLTVWSAVSTTTTVTMLYTDTNTTVRLSYFCQAGLQGRSAEGLVMVCDDFDTRTGTAAVQMTSEL